MKTVIEMAEEAGIPAFGDIFLRVDDLKRFAELVAAAEREACAKVCDRMGHPSKLDYVGIGGAACAAAIRARSNT